MIAESLMAAFSVLAAAAPQVPYCQLARLVELPVTMVGLQPRVPVKINGQEVMLIADSGAFFSMLTPEAAERLGIRGEPAPYGLRVRGIGGHETDVKVGKVKDFVFGALPPFHNTDFLIGGQEGGLGAAGLLGQNVLGVFDVEYDLANGVIRLFKPSNCGDRPLAYWAGGQSFSVLTIPPRTPLQPHIVASAKIDDKSIRVTFDSGASTSFLSRPAAARVGIRPEGDGVVAAGVDHGVARGAVETSLAPFDNFTIGDEEIQHTRLRVGDLELPGSDMLLGADFFLSHRIYVSNTQHRLYFTYNGGPVFRLDRPHPALLPSVAVTADLRPADSTQSGKGAAGAPTSAAEFSRRGSAFMSRHDFTAAIADFTRAAELEPVNPTLLADRATARLDAGQPILAMADLDQALKLKPDDVQALMIRGMLYLGDKDLARGQADFDAAAKAAADDSTIRLRIAGNYRRAGLYAEAVAGYSDWIAAHPRHPALAIALNDRCETRAIWGHELKEALSDCNQAIRLGPRDSGMMENRGVVALRLGRLDDSISDFNAALRMQPKAIWSLYCRGLAKQRKGLRDEGSADIKAALVLEPDLMDAAKRLGLTTVTEEPAA